MKNLKRILSLALASVMVMGMMVVGASAAFNDQAEINANNVDAVNTMVALKILSGKEGNQFYPKGDVTRAEMATMIAMALNGGNADFRGTTTTGFTDVDGVKHWAAKFIKYCVDQGILSGVGGGKFNPDANVTAQEAATMILTAMGYKKEMLKSETSDWAAKINLTAEQRRLYDDTKVTDYTQDIDRETAAQMVFNGITVKTPNISDSYNVTTGEHTYMVTNLNGDSILESAFKAEMKYAVMQKISYNSSNKQYTYTLDGGLAGGDTTSQFDDTTVGTLNSTEDHADLFLKRVRVLYDTNKNIIAITEVGESVLSSGAIGDLAFRSGKLDGKELDGSGIKLWNFGADATTGGQAIAQNSDITTARTGISPSSKYELMDYNVDGKIDAIVLYPVTVATVSYIGKDYVNAGANRSEKNYDYGTLAENDVVLVTEPLTALNRKGTLEKLELTEMTFDGIQDGKYRSAGQWYTDVATGVTAIDLGANKTWKAAVVNGYIVARQAVETAAEVGDVVIVAAADSPKGANNFTGDPAYIPVRVMDLDGNYSIINVTKKAGNPATAIAAADVAAHTLLTYAEDPDNEGYYIVAPYATPNGAFKKDDTAEIVVKNGKITGGSTDTAAYNINATGKFFVAVTLDGDAAETLKVVTGADIAKWGFAYQTGTTAKNVVYATTINGFKTANLGVLTLAAVDVNDNGSFADTDENKITAFPGIASSEVLAWTTSDAILSKENNRDFLEIKVWDGEAERTIKVTSVGATAVTSSTDETDWTAGMPVTFKENGNGYATALALVNSGTPSYVNAWDGKNIQIDEGATAQVDDTWTILYVDTAENEGVAGGSIQIARKDALGNYVANVYYSGKLLVVDVSNQLAGLAGVNKITADGTVVKEINTTARTAKIATGKTVADLDGKITVAASFVVVKADGTVAEDADAIETDWTLRVAALDGTVIDLTITVE